MRLSELVICHKAGGINSHQDMLLKQSPMDSGHRYFLSSCGGSPWQANSYLLVFVL